MAEKNQRGERNAGNDSHDKNDSHESNKSFDWGHVWKSVEHAGSQAGNAIKHKVDQIDTKDVAGKAKHAASDGLKVVRGKSGNKQANEISDAAAHYLPGAGLVREGANLAHETGVDRKVLEGKGTVHAPSERTMRNLGKEAVGSAIPIPGANEVLNRTGLKDQVIDSAIGAAKGKAESAEHAEHARGTRGGGGGRGKPEAGLPKVDLHEDKGVIDSAKDKVGKFLHGLHKPEVKEEKKKEK